MPLIFRLESKCGTGPFRPIRDNKRLSRFLWHGNYRDCHVCPMDDETLAYDWCLLRERGNEFRDEYDFGFDDLLQFREWLTSDDRVKIKQFEDDKFEYRISVYQLDKKDLIVGDSQVIFIRDDAVLVGRIDPYDLGAISHDMKLINDNIRWYKNNERR